MSIEIALFGYRVLGRWEWGVEWGRTKQAVSVVVRTGGVEWGLTIVVGDYK